MSYQNYLHQSTPVPTVEFSEIESQRIGMRVGRLSCGLGTDWATFDPVSIITSADVDIVIVRYPAEQYSIAETLQASSLSSWVADTLIYLEASVTKVPKPKGAFSLVPCETFGPRVEQLVARIFGGYRNHYSASSLFADVDVAESYVDWTRHQLQETTGECWILQDSSEKDAALAVWDTGSPDSNEITLIGVDPSFRGGGVFAELLGHLAEVTKSSGKTRLNTSTQAANIPSLRGLSKAGFLPVLSLNTLHISKPGVVKQGK